MMLHLVNGLNDVALFPMKPIRLFFAAVALSSCACVLVAQQHPSQHHFNTPKPSVAPTTPEPRFPVLVDNARLRVSRIELAPNSESPMLPHDYDYLLVSIGASNVELAGSSNRFPVTMQDGEMQVIPGRWAHRFVNRADQPARLVMIESRTAMKPDAALCGLGHEDCHQVNFAKDGAVEYTQAMMFETPTVRLLKAELTVGATLPRHEHGADHLLVALTKLDLTADHENVLRDPGTVFWHSGGFASLKNTGEESARFLVLEVK
jgi:hypothetical protein